MTLRVVAGTANPALATDVAGAVGVELTPCTVQRFPDGELRPALAELRGDDVFVVQPTGPPVSDHLVELLLELDACRRAGADRLTAVVPYFGYARQDRRTSAGEAVGVRVVADAIVAAGADRLLVVDPHTAALEALCSIPVDMLTAVPVLAAAVQPVDEQTVIVAPDLGAVKLAERYAARLHRPVAVVRKTRISGAVVSAHELVGAVWGRAALVVDDMISTGATIEAAAAVLGAHGAGGDLTVAATHGPLVPAAARRIHAAGATRLVVSDTLAAPDPQLLQVTSVAAVLADAVGRLHRDRPLDDLLLHG